MTSFSCIDSSFDFQNLNDLEFLTCPVSSQFSNEYVFIKLLMKGQASGLMLRIKH